MELLRISWSTNPHDSASQRLKVRLGQLRPNWQQVAGNEEGLSRHLQAAQTRHAVSVAQGSICNPAVLPFLFCVVSGLYSVRIEFPDRRKDKRSGKCRRA